MPGNKKITQLDFMAGVANEDLLLIVDDPSGNPINRKITVGNFLGGLVPPIAGSYVTAVAEPLLIGSRLLQGTANQVIVTDGGAGGNIVLSAPQDIGLLSTPTFGGLTINGNILVTGTVDGVDVSTLNTLVGNISNATFVTMSASAFLANERILIGTANQITITDGGAGGNVTISLPSDINLTGASSIGTTAGALTLDPATEVDVTGNLFVDGNANEVQLRVQATAGQTANIWTVENSAGAVLAGADERGILFSHGNIDADSVYVGNDAGNIAHTNALRNVGIGSSCLQALTTGDNNVAIGYQVNVFNQTGYANVMIGFEAGYGAAGNSHYENNFIGYRAGYTITTGYENVAIGANALDAITTGARNVSIGKDSLTSLQTGSNNVAIGRRALYNANSTSNNFGLGAGSLEGNTTGLSNIGIGNNAGYGNQIGNDNVYIGATAGMGVAGNSNSNNVGIGSTVLFSITTGERNVCIGYSAGYRLTTSVRNVYIGYLSGNRTTTAGNNVGIGYQSLAGALGAVYANTVAIGYGAGLNMVSGSNNTLVGYQSGDVITTGSNNIIIGYDVDPTGAAVNDQLNIGALIYGDVSATKRAGINVTPPSLAGTFHVDQISTTGAVPVLVLDQADVDVVLAKIIGTAEAASADRTLVAASDFTTPGALIGWIQINVQDDGNRVADADYWIPFYATPTP